MGGCGGDGWASEATLKQDGSCLATKDTHGGHQEQEPQFILEPRPNLA